VVVVSNASRLLIEVQVEGAKVSITQLEGVDAATASVGKSGKTAAKAAKEHDEALKKLGKVASVISATGIAVVGGAIYESIKAGIAWQKQLTGLETTLGNVGVKHAKAAAGHIGAVTEALSTRGGYNAEEQIGGINQFLRESQSQKQALKDNETAMNFARSSGQEYAQVQKYMAMALTGSTGRLEKQVGYIPKVTEHVKAVSEAESARKKILEKSGVYELTAAEQKNFEVQKQRATQLDKVATAERGIQRLQAKGAGGMAKYAHTAAGMWSDMKNQIDIAFRKFSTKLLPVVTMLFRTITGGLMWIIDHKAVWVPIAALAAAIWTAATAWKVYTGYQKLMQFWTALTTKGLKATALGVEEQTAATEAQTVANGEAAASFGLLDAAMAVSGVIIMVGLVVAIVELVKHFKQVKEVAATVFHAVLGAIKTAWGWVKQNWPLLLPILLGPFGLVIGGFLKFKKQIIGIFEEVVGWIEHAFTNVLHFIESIPMKIVHGFERLPGMVGSVLKKIPVVGAVMGAVGSVGHALGLNAGGQVPRVRRFAPGGIVPGYGSSDSVPALLTPGEFILRKQAVSAIGVGTLERANQLGGGATAAGGGEEYVPIQIINKLDSRVLSESQARYLLKRKRLAPGNFAGPPVSNPSIAGAL
jgi:hypothetical protein